MNNGAYWYREGRVLVKVHFPEGRVVCQNCRAFLRYDKDTGGRYCFLTGEPVGSPERQIGGLCPLELEGT